ncbi:CheC, inhibitor of MCP methylation [Caldicellulosiruptor saccharolyticus DSM 8903]|uniref:CheC, inhibitor of MCP methylation n=1 Tax=Caldicellulosiruptor saccharolyticus (strain ATCC 43494 / DSM 8903 / Tp8T 6331) TaxID=351627 RepID=A4XJ00_CALS8|nr:MULTISPECIES: chemotaxis protein CheC [Caldicellulosiruptor]ABP66885.1 CheC, inhibitor of MCP methylation [Caldicellulosiruptor saccharolyticus DSM 8903]
MNFSSNEINEMYLDVLRELGNIGTGNAISALAMMIGRRIDMKVPVVKMVDLKEVPEILGGAEIPVVGILLNVEGDIDGFIMLVMSQASAHILVNMLLGTSLNGYSEFTDIEKSALTEIGNILAGAYLTALASLTGFKMIQSVPQLAEDMAGAILSFPAIQFGETGDTALYIETEIFESSSRIVADFFLIPTIESYQKMLKALGVA